MHNGQLAWGRCIRNTDLGHKIWILQIHLNIELNKSWWLRLIFPKSTSSWVLTLWAAVKCSTYCSFFPPGSTYTTMCWCGLYSHNFLAIILEWYIFLMIFVLVQSSDDGCFFPYLRGKNDLTNFKDLQIPTIKKVNMLKKNQFHKLHSTWSQLFYST